MQTASEAAAAFVARLAHTIRDADGPTTLAGLAPALAALVAAERQAVREACAEKIDQQRQLISGMFEDRRHEPLCRDLADALRRLPID